MNVRELDIKMKTLRSFLLHSRYSDMTLKLKPTKCYMGSFYRLTLNLRGEFLTSTADLIFQDLDDLTQAVIDDRLHQALF